MDISPSNESDEPATKRICARCVDEPFLKALIGAAGVEAYCSYCEAESRTITIEELADHVETAFDHHYERTPTEPEGLEAAMLSENEGSYSWKRHGEQVLWAIANAAGIKEEAAGDVVSVLEERHSDHESAKMGEECPFDKNSYYAEKNPGCDEFSAKWSEFENGLKTEARFFSRSAQVTLDEIFADLPNLRTSKASPAVMSVGPEAEIKSLYRARVFAAEDEKLEEALKYPWEHLGPPPMLAATAGRMNARGISVFYGAIESATALAEVRPPVGSKVAIAKFTIERSLKLLDVEALKSVAITGSIFDPGFMGLIQRANFLEILSGRISRPVMPNEEAFEYLATQAVADYLATEAKLDGIIFPSVQVGHASSNVVLFHHSSRVTEVELPKGTDLTAILEQHDSDGVSPDYHVWEVVPRTPATAAPSEPDPFNLDLTPVNYELFDPRIPSLKIDFASVTVHHIKAVNFNADEYPVKRYHTVEPE
ncbi:MAG: RES family NAD+ phosphorylase [Verrucomicrobiota bacterium]|jgi:hypothetical protein